ncbi:PqqD family protein [Cellulosimicrobium marinum]|uniref:PqqD family protein n=1 Tax=Cellulosimicrobium marinum TaxID=1638992 RepID=UPI001E2AB0C0|nr:PqqD family protein [Cellulosimicrobium marinum]MCB7137063.1 PqqD family protein [Cellulosimicrobium marinum]
MRIKTEGISWQELDGELVILDLDRSVYLTTNAAGAELAKQLLEDRTLDDLADHLVDVYEIDRETAVRDAQAFVDALREKQLLA